MKTQLQQLIKKTIEKLSLTDEIAKTIVEKIYLENSRDAKHGDFACTIALALAKLASGNPRQWAEKIVQHLSANELIAKIEIAGPGFINFFVTDSAFQTIVEDILNAGDCYGCFNLGNGKKVLIEFVSSNPTGPLHVGHGRGAAYGATVASLLEAVGYTVHREYYVNDAGRQMDILTLSIWLRYLELFHKKIVFPSACYKGNYVIEIAEQLQSTQDALFFHDLTGFYEQLPIDNEENKDTYVDQLISRAKKILGEKYYQMIFSTGLDTILKDMKEDLAEFGVTYDEWFHESALSKDIQRGLDQLKKAGHLYQKDGATWFEATAFGDEKDRVVFREDGRPTYFAADIGYHLNKYQRGFDLIIDVFGADHHGYAPRINAFLQALKQDINKLVILWVQFAILYRGKEKIRMSTRTGEFVTLRQLREEVGNDAARFFYIMRKNEQHLDFDLELAKSQTADNPVYYIQYAHARICSVFRQAEQKNFTYEQTMGLSHLQRLSSDYEKQLLRSLAQYPEVVQRAATHYEAHLIPHYLQELAQLFHTYYNAEQFLLDDDALRNARLCLIAAVRSVLKHGLKL